MYRAVMSAQLLYGASSWVVPAHTQRSLRSFQQKCLRHCLRMHPKIEDGNLKYPTREEVLQRAKEPDIMALNDAAALRWLGHVLREDGNPVARVLPAACASPLPNLGGVTTTLHLTTRFNTLLDRAKLTPADAADRVKWRKAVNVFLRANAGNRP